MTKKLLKDMIGYSPAQIIPGIVGFIGILIITRLFSPGGYGNYVLVIATVDVLVIFIGWLSMSIIRFYPAYEKEGKAFEFYSTVIKLTFISVIIILIIGILFLFVLKSKMASELYLLLMIGTGVFAALSLFSVLQDFLRAKRIIWWYSGFYVWKSIVSLVVGVLLIIFFGFGISGLLYGTIISLVIIFPILWKKAMGGAAVFAGKVSRKCAVEMVKYGFPLVIGNLAAWILSLSDRYVIEFFRDSSEVGIYSASYGITEKSIFLFTSLFLLASGPLAIHVWEKEGAEKTKEFVGELTRLFLITCIPVIVGLIVISKPLMEIMVPKEYFMGVRIIPFIAIGAFFLGLQQRYQSGFVFYKKSGFIMFSIVISGLLNLLLNLLLIPKHGYMAAAITTLIGYLFLFVLMVVGSMKLFRWRFPVKTLFKSLTASFIMAGCMHLFISFSLFSWKGWELFFYVFLGMMIYGLSIFLMKELNASEIQKIKAMCFGNR